MDFTYDYISVLSVLFVSALAICFFWIGEKLSGKTVTDVVFGVIFLAAGVYIPFLYPALVSDYLAAFGIFCFASGARFLGFAVIRIIFPDPAKPPHDSSTKRQPGNSEVLARIGKHEPQKHNHAKSCQNQQQAPANCFRRFFLLRQKIARNPERTGKQCNRRKNRGTKKHGQKNGVRIGMFRWKSAFPTRPKKMKETSDVPCGKKNLSP